MTDAQRKIALYRLASAYVEGYNTKELDALAIRAVEEFDTELGLSKPARECPKCEGTGILIMGLGSAVPCDLCDGTKRTNRREVRTLRDGTQEEVTYGKASPEAQAVSHAYARR